MSRQLSSLFISIISSLIHISIPLVTPTCIPFVFAADIFDSELIFPDDAGSKLRAQCRTPETTVDIEDLASAARPDLESFSQQETRNRKNQRIIREKEGCFDDLVDLKEASGEKGVGGTDTGVEKEVETGVVAIVEFLSNGNGLDEEFLLRGKESHLELAPDPDVVVDEKKVDRNVRFVEVWRRVSSSGDIFRLIQRQRVRRFYDCSTGRLKWIPESSNGDLVPIFLTNSNDCLAWGVGFGGADISFVTIGSEIIEDEHLSPLGSMHQLSVVSGPSHAESSDVLHPKILPCHHASLWTGVICGGVEKDGQIVQFLPPLVPVTEFRGAGLSRISEQVFLQKLDEIVPVGFANVFTESDKQCRDKWIYSVYGGFLVGAGLLGNESDKTGEISGDAGEADRRGLKTSYNFDKSKAALFSVLEREEKDWHHRSNEMALKVDGLLDEMEFKVSGGFRNLMMNWVKGLLEEEPDMDVQSEGGNGLGAENAVQQLVGLTTATTLMRQTSDPNEIKSSQNDSNFLRRLLLRLHRIFNPPSLDIKSDTFEVFLSFSLSWESVRAGLFEELQKQHFPAGALAAFEGHSINSVFRSLPWYEDAKSDLDLLEEGKLQILPNYERFLEKVVGKIFNGLGDADVLDGMDVWDVKFGIYNANRKKNVGSPTQSVFWKTLKSSISIFSKEGNWIEGEEGGKGGKFVCRLGKFKNGGRAGVLTVGLFRTGSEGKHAEPSILRYFDTEELVKVNDEDTIDTTHKDKEDQDDNLRPSIYLLNIDSLSRITLSHFAPALAKLFNPKNDKQPSGASSHLPISFQRFHTPVFGGTVPNLFPIFYGGSKQNCGYTKTNHTSAAIECAAEERVLKVLKEEGGYQVSVSGSDHDFPHTDFDRSFILPEEPEKKRWRVKGNDGKISVLSDVLEWNERRLLKSLDKNGSPQFVVSHFDFSHEEGIHFLHGEVERMIAEHLERVIALNNKQTRRPLLIMLLGDHGMADLQFGIAGSAAGSCDQKRPFLGMLVPKEIVKNGLIHESILHENAVKALVSGWDLHATLIGMVRGHGHENDSRDGDISNSIIEAAPRKLDAGKTRIADFSVSGELDKQLVKLQEEHLAKRGGKSDAITSGEQVEVDREIGAPVFYRDELKPVSLFSEKLRERGDGNCRAAGIVSHHCEARTGLIDGTAVESTSPTDKHQHSEHSFTLFCNKYEQLHPLTRLQLLLESPSVDSSSTIISSDRDNLSPSYQDAICHLWFQLTETLVYLRANELEENTAFRNSCSAFRLKSVDSVSFKTRKDSAWLDSNTNSENFGVTEVTVRFQTETVQRAETTSEMDFDTFDTTSRLHEFDTYLPQFDLKNPIYYRNAGEIRERNLRELTRYRPFENCSPEGIDPMVCTCKVQEGSSKEEVREGISEVMSDVGGDVDGGSVVDNDGKKGKKEDENENEKNPVNREELYFVLLLGVKIFCVVRRSRRNIASGFSTYSFEEIFFREFLKIDFS